MAEPMNAKWKQIEEGYCICLHFSNCVGALDSKHIMIKTPSNTGSLFRNYKGHFSIVLLTLADANYRFIYVDIDEYGSNSDGSVFKASNFGKKYILERNTSLTRWEFLETNCYLTFLYLTSLLLMKPSHYCQF